eukprot:12101171-Ditylum_brightwellii.AAC.1
MDTMKLMFGQHTVLFHQQGSILHQFVLGRFLKHEIDVIGRKNCRLIQDSWNVNEFIVYGIFKDIADLFHEQFIHFKDSTGSQ